MSMGESIVQGAISSGGRLDRALAESCPADAALSRERIKALIGEGRVTIDGRTVSQASMKVAAGAQFIINLPEASPLDAVAQDIPLNVVYEDDHLIVVDKPAGLVVHPAAGNPDGTLVNALLHHCAGQLSGIGGVARPGIVHRIDKDTSGLLVVAKSDIAHEGLARQFADHSIERAYLALTQGIPNPPRGTLRGVIARHPTDRKRMALMPETLIKPGGDANADDDTGPKRGKHAVTHFRLLESLDRAALVECRLETGRTHQVRVHMASIGHALLGDPVYARSQKSQKPILTELGFARQALHAAVLGFTHPVTGETIRFASQLPADMRELLHRLGGSDADQPVSSLLSGAIGPGGKEGQPWPPPRDAC
ncbi:RluA family pseudouridine synthase [Novosphingobium sediminicola]|uniref:Pseudouridine synthase n=1 Tax=Novosphingobium sediminicola TaxID=563162 RepID=A0A7W6G665_9SPHN|nr:RluA family pseudouridine synthase [Novosphingobium sediminicola]MBB3954973.1 23S rRNA pseudouridine1911/1915/1917 synthase [Novosphingobium sediminicola]